IESDRHVGFARYPCQKLAVRHFHQLLELEKLLRRELVYRSLRKPSHDQIELPHSTMPGAKENPAPENLQLAPLCCPCHGPSPVGITPKARTEPGPADIAMEGTNVSGLVCAESATRRGGAAGRQAWSPVPSRHVGCVRASVGTGAEEPVVIVRVDVVRL